MHSNKISENRESMDNKVENHDISFCKKKKKKKSFSISLKKITYFYFFCRDYSYDNIL